MDISPSLLTNIDMIMSLSIFGIYFSVVSRCSYFGGSLSTFIPVINLYFKYFNDFNLKHCVLTPHVQSLTESASILFICYKPFW